MKLSINKIMAFFVVGMFILANTSSVFAASVPWKSYSSSAFATAKAQHKQVLIYVKSNTCHWCSLMNSESFNQPAIVQTISSKFVPVAVDIVSDKAISDKYNAYGTPTFIILDSNSHEVSRQTGYLTPSEFKSYLDRQ